MIFAVMLNHPKQEICIGRFANKELYDETARNFDPTRHPTSIFDNIKLAVSEARRLARVSRWKYNPKANFAIKRRD